MMFPPLTIASASSESMPRAAVRVGAVQKGTVIKFRLSLRLHQTLV
jgi:hypothetical protein